MKIVLNIEGHRINLQSRTDDTEGDCERCSEPWCKFNITPDSRLTEYMQGNREVMKNITCGSYEADNDCIQPSI
jgi:hypothetical protein